MAVLLETSSSNALSRMNSEENTKDHPSIIISSRLGQFVIRTGLVKVADGGREKAKEGKKEL